MTNRSKPTPVRRGIQSVETGLRVLDALAACGSPVPLSAVAQRAGLSLSQAHRYLASLIASGMAKQEPATGFYDLGSGAIRLGLAALARLDIFGLSDKAFSAYARSTGRTCLVAVWGEAGATVIRWFPGHPAVVTSLGIGSIMPLLRSATGRVFLTFGDRATMDTAAKLALVNDRASTPAGLAVVRRSVQMAREARVDSLLIPGLRAVAAPVFDLQGRLALVATSIATPAFDPSGDDAAAEALHVACRSVMDATGGTPPALAPEALDGDRPAGRRRAR